MGKVKQQIKSLIEAMGLGFAADKARFWYQYAQQKGKINAFKAAHPGMPLPTPFMIYETFRLDYAKYLETGRAAAESIYQEVNPFIALQGKAILDWGCGPGRVVRHFPDLLPTARVYGSDYNSEYVNWCRDNLKQITFTQNQLAPPIPLEAGSLDFIYAISIFTHLSAKMHLEWMNEMYRLLKPGGVFYFTTHGDITRKNLLESEKMQYDNGIIVERGNVKEGYRMYATYHPPAFIEQLVAGKFSVLHHRPGKAKDWGLEQDVWIIRKNG
ncbi:MAG: class I SAM-dependent methyltransferase [Sphingobacteriales bacterium]|nr:MAG: class I SAM-dependent methyltransferase [Sphingobacteriales bacterium]